MIHIKIKYKIAAPTHADHTVSNCHHVYVRGHPARYLNGHPINKNTSTKRKLQLQTKS